MSERPLLSRRSVSAFATMMAVLAKDLRVEWKSREIIATVLFFAVSLVVVFSFAFPRGPVLLQAAIPGMVWTAILFSSTIALSRAFDREREQDTLRALLLSPAPRIGIFFGKMLSMWLLIVVIGSIVLLASGFFLQMPMGAQLGVTWPKGAAGPSWFGLWLHILLGGLGLASIGVVLAAMLLRSQARDVLLPVVLYPLSIPLLLAATKSLTGMLEGASLQEIRYWLGFMGAYDALFLVTSAWIFEWVVVE